MLRTKLLLTAGLLLLPLSAFAQGTDCPLHKKLDSQTLTQSVELSPITVSAPIIEIEALRISTPRQSAPENRVPSPQAAAERGVDIQAGPVMMAENTAQAAMAAETPQKDMKKDMMKDTVMTPSQHADWTDILQSYVGMPDEAGLTHFDYAGLKANAADTAKLDGYIKSLEGMTPDELSENEAIAFWANLYNAVTIQVVTEKYPVKSIRKLGSFNSGPWKKKLVTVNGVRMSLDDIEHKTLRKHYPSPYIHYMVNCASVGCPNLLDTAWEADTLEAGRIKAAKAYINSPRGAVVKGDKLTVSSIYDWFEEDFGGSKEGVLKHLQEHATGDLAVAIAAGEKITNYDYDWSLNK
ncbi:MAG: DUF547 domain-containing protein [Hellea sp.]